MGAGADAGAGEEGDGMKEAGCEIITRLRSKAKCRLKAFEAKPREPESELLPEPETLPRPECEPGEIEARFGVPETWSRNAFFATRAPGIGRA